MCTPHQGLQKEEGWRQCVYTMRVGCKGQQLLTAACGVQLAIQHKVAGWLSRPKSNAKCSKLSLRLAQATHSNDP